MFLTAHTATQDIAGRSSECVWFHYSRRGEVVNLAWNDRRISRSKHVGLLIIDIGDRRFVVADRIHLVLLGVLTSRPNSIHYGTLA